MRRLPSVTPVACVWGHFPAGDACSMEMFKARPCYCCEDGVIALRDAIGRTLPYKDSPGVTIATSIRVPMCNSCGEMLLNRSEITALDEALEAAYKRQRPHRS
jgi:hypothetical protein